MAPVIVSGALANKPMNGGEAWVRLSWLLGLLRLGFDIHFVEQIDPADCVDRTGAPVDFERSINHEFFRRVVSDFDLDDRATLLCTGSQRTSGLAFAELRELCAGSSVLFNISGHLRAAELPVGGTGVYVDLDPGFTQFWHQQGADLGLQRHQHFLTVATNIGAEECQIPTGGLAWHPILPPVLTGLWAAQPSPPEPGRFTTVAKWRNDFGPIEHEGTRYGLKLHEFRRFWDLPRSSRASFEIALDIHPGDERDRRELLARGWQLSDPVAVASDPARVQDFIRGSGAEISVAQGLYVATRSGWFSDRTACYLASGRPALVQDTGIAPELAGRGLLTFSTLEEATEGVEAILADYEAHASAARELAEAHLDSDAVLGGMLDGLGLAP